VGLQNFRPPRKILGLRRNAEYGGELRPTRHAAQLRLRNRRPHFQARQQQKKRLRKIENTHNQAATDSFEKNLMVPGAGLEPALPLPEKGF
jgi:hypothetical protein